MRAEEIEDFVRIAGFEDGSLKAAENISVKKSDVYVVFNDQKVWWDLGLSGKA